MTLRQISITAALVIALSIAPVQAQETSTRVGVGVGVDPVRSLLTSIDRFASPVALYVPIQSDGFRIEPQFGFLRQSEERTINGETEDRTVSALELGAGVFATPEIGDDANAHVGGRLGIVRFSESFSGPPDTNDETATDVFIGPAAGGEYFLSENFSLGGEVRFLYINLGEGDTGDADVSRTRFQTGATFFTRIYF